ncbi:MAG: metallophosphoesterase [Lachnospiraceae bacterium]|nr:metallophosphoesterase [Lachnospiraceae bacterium]
MKIIHTADLHLDSNLESNLSKSRAEERRNELLAMFRNIVGYAASNGIEAILIAGDLFDMCDVSKTALDVVISTIAGNPDIKFYYLRGNHDEGAFVEDFRSRMGKLPEHFMTFSEAWQSYELTGKDSVKVVITGAEITKRNTNNLASMLHLNEENINIVMLHGQEADVRGSSENTGDGEIIPLREYQNKGIDYLALGHIHTPSVNRLDARGVYSYCGCPEGRGFDEVGARGFNVINVDHDGLKVDFIPFAKRVIYDINVDVADCSDTEEIIQRIKDTALNSGVCSKDLVKARLCGEVNLLTEIHTDYIKTVLEPEYYVIKIVDETRPLLDYSEFAADASLKGEYIRLIKEEVDAGNLDEETAANLVRSGIQLLYNPNSAIIK